MSLQVTLSGTEISDTFAPTTSQECVRKETGALLKTLLQRIVKNPDDVLVTCMTGERTTVFNIAVHLDDYRYLLGKKGTTINSLRVVLRAIMARHQIRVVLEAPHTPHMGSSQSDY
ncbi:KH domain-containing protein [Bdellovibrio svalbardensis]|uniref:KH domain-containing protein n=1 Tax=Bdellovibrio svalbardensis TaxID=2972972 RepID=A0ABT6DG34_9BACT|nr:KH domain-containing protein [Bdellovibrio svalbardensis]MDG0815781.1 KH domain-containing protein [Bdellovibrio svalbardensis]